MTANVLLVDDDPKVLRLLEATLRLKQYEVVKMESGLHALEYLKNNIPDLIISDIMMPDLDGYGFFQQVRAVTRAGRVPFIFLSARSEPEDVVRGLKLGADEFLRKPFSIDELLVRVERVLQRAQRTELASKGVFEGDLGYMPLEDVLRMFCVQRRTGVLRIELPELHGNAVLQVRRGHVVHAEFGRLESESVLFQLLLHDRGRFVFSSEEQIEGHSINVQTLPLLMEGLRLKGIGVLKRIDPLDKAAVDALAEAIRPHRAESSALPRIPVDSGSSKPAPGSIMGGVPPIDGLVPQETGEQPPVREEDSDFVAHADELSDTHAISQSELVPINELIGGAPPARSGDVEVVHGLGALPDDELGDDGWDRAGLLEEPAQEAFFGQDELEELDDLEGLDEEEAARVTGSATPNDLNRPAAARPAAAVTDDDDASVIISFDEVEALLASRSSASTSAVLEHGSDGVASPVLVLGDEDSFDDSSEFAAVLVSDGAGYGDVDDDPVDAAPGQIIVGSVDASESLDQAARAASFDNSFDPAFDAVPPGTLPEAARTGGASQSAELDADDAATTGPERRSRDRRRARERRRSEPDENRDYSTDVALVEDTAYSPPAVEFDVSAESDALMDLYEDLKVAASKQLKTRAVQLSTRGGRLVASAIRDLERQGTVAAFSAQAISFATKDPTGLLYATLDAGDVNVFVVEVDERRVFTALFDEHRPGPVAILDAFRDPLERYRAAREEDDS